MSKAKTNGTVRNEPFALSGFDPILANNLGDLVGNLTALRKSFFDTLSNVDSRRDINDECGYPDTSALSAELYRDLYDREPIAARVVQLMPKECWQLQPLVYEDESAENVTQFEEGFQAIEVNQPGSSWHQDSGGGTVWEMLSRFDTLSRIGHFGVLLIGFDDGRNLQDPADGIEALDQSVQGSGDAGQATKNAAWRPLDNPLSDSEEEALINPKPRKVWNGKFDLIKDPTMNRWKREPQMTERWQHPLSKSEKSIVENWRAERKMVENAARQSKVSESELLCNQDFINNLILKKGQDPAGSDRQYDQSANPLGASASGTDQQYFGVQFGPSESFSSEPFKGPCKVLFLRAFDESLVQVVRYEWNVRNPRFGLPVMYRITLNDPRETHSGVGLPLATVFVHWSRVIHTNDVNANAGSSEIFSAPAMRPVLNPILDVRKIRGAAGEGYWKSCFTAHSFETHPQLGGDVAVDSQAMQDMYEQFQNGLQRALYTTGMTVKTLAPQVIDPTPFISINIEAICIQLGCPVRVFKGSERGELASSQDDASWNDRVAHRQNFYVTPRIIVPFIDRLIQVGALPPPGKSAKEKVDNFLSLNERCKATRLRGGWALTINAGDKEMQKGFVADAGYTVMWPDLDSLGDKDKSAIALQKAQAIAAYVSGNLEAVMTPEFFFVHVMNFTEEVAQACVESVKSAHEDDMMTLPPKGESGHPATVPPPPPKVPPSPIKLKDGEKLVMPPGADDDAEN